MPAVKSAKGSSAERLVRVCTSVRSASNGDGASRRASASSSSVLGKPSVRLSSAEAATLRPCCLATALRTRRPPLEDPKSVVEGKSVSVRVELGGLTIIKKKNNTHTHT